MAKKRTGAAKAKQPTPPQDDLDLDIPEDEQRRLIEASGILGKMSELPAQPPKDAVQESVLPPHIEELCYALFYIIPFSSCLLTFEILIHYQYGLTPDFATVMERMLPGVPILSIFVFYALRHKDTRATQLLLLFLSFAGGSRLIWMINHSNFQANMQQCPPLATLWIFSIVVLDLGPACLSLLAVGAFVWFKDLKMVL